MLESSSLINYWPMSNLNDQMGGANLFGGSNYLFTSDRFCSPNSAIYFNKGYLQVPSGVYFTGDFTVTAWIYLKSYQSYSRIFDFGNGQASDNVLLGINSTHSKIRGNIFDISLSVSPIITSSLINLNEWYFISFVLNGTTVYIYVNGKQVKNGASKKPNNILRTNNYIGKSNWVGHLNADAVYDEFKIYQGALSSSDILNEYLISSNNSIINKRPKLISLFYNIFIKGIFNNSCQTTSSTKFTTTTNTFTTSTTSPISTTTSFFLTTINTSISTTSSISISTNSTPLTIIPNNLTSISNISQSLQALSI
jgi:hypothetical protein